MTTTENINSPNMVHAILIANQFDQATEATLESLKTQDYSNLDISLVDISGSSYEEFAGFRVRKSAKTKSQSATINEAIKNSDADYVFLLSEDVILQQGVITELMKEVGESEAVVVGAKMVEKDSQQLVEVGVGIDKTGAVSTGAFYGELDQGQYDLPDSTFAIHKECMLLNRNMFVTLGGFDEKMEKSFCDIDFCWRVHLAGAKVRVAPQAVCLVQGERKAKRSQFSHPHYFSQLRMMLGCYSLGSLFIILPQVFVVALFGILSSLVTFSLKRALNIFYSWLKVFFTIFGILNKRERIAPNRRVADSSIRKLQDQGFASLTTFLRDNDFSFTSMRKLFHGRGVWVVWVAIVVALFFGSRHLITQAFPQVGELLPFQSNFLGDWFDSYQSNGLGRDSYSSNAGLWLGILHIIFFGADALARTVFFLAMFVAGAWGVWYLLNQITSKPGSKVVGTITYLLIPLPYIALSKGDLDALILYACAPWIFAFLIRHLVQKRHLLLQFLFLGLVVGFVAGFSLYVFALLVFMMLAALAASFISGILNFKSIAVGIAGGLLGILLNFTYLSSSRGVQFWEWRPDSTLDSSKGYGLQDIMSFNLSTLSLNYLVWGFIGAAFLLLLLAKEKRSMWMIYGWALYLGGVVVAWTAEQGWHNFASPEVLLIPASLGLAIALGMGVDILRFDLVKKVFSWSKFSLALTGLMFLAAALPVLTLSLNGRWNLPQSDYSTTYQSIQSSSQRVLWIGHPDVLGPSSWKLNDAVAFSITQDSTLDITQVWSGAKDSNIELVEQELLKLNREDRIGAKLAFFGIGHIVLVEKFHPTSPETYPLGSSLNSQFDSQLDLKQLNTRNGIRVFENNQVIPIRANFPSGALAGETLSPDVPTEVFKDSSTQNIGAGDFYLADASPNWEFRIDGQEVESESAFTWARQYSHSGGVAKLTYNSKVFYKFILVAQIFVWLMFIALAILRARRLRGKYR